VFLPALATTGALYRDVDAALAACRPRVFVDLPGAGESPVAERFDAGQVLRAVEDVIDANGGRAILVGSSLGGAVAVRLAAQSPGKVESLILLDVPAAPFALTRWERLVLHPAAWGPGYRLLGGRDVVRGALPRLVGPRGDPLTVAIIARDLDDSRRRDATMRYYRVFLAPEKIAETRAALDRVQAPSLVLWGDRDPVVALSTMDDVVTGLAQTRVTRKTFAAGHLPALEVPREVARAIDDFVNANANANANANVNVNVNVNALRPGATVFGPRSEWFPLLGLNAMFPVGSSLSGRADVAVLAGIARGGIDPHWPLESGRVVVLVGAAAHSDPINSTSWSFGYLRATTRLEMVWRYAGGFHLDLTLLVDPLPDRLYRVGGLGAIGYTPSVVPWLRAFVGWGVLPGGDGQALLGVELDTRLTGLMY
jgi:pimeloyl-ACP methyl ester carboxylesterase